MSSRHCSVIEYLKIFPISFTLLVGVALFLLIRKLWHRSTKQESDCVNSEIKRQGSLAENQNVHPFLSTGRFGKYCIQKSNHEIEPVSQVTTKSPETMKIEEIPQRIEVAPEAEYSVIESERTAYNSPEDQELDETDYDDDGTVECKVHEDGAKVYGNDELLADKLRKPEIAEHFPSLMKKARNKHLIKDAKEELTEFELKSEYELRQQQLREIFSIMQDKKDTFGINSFEEINEQMNLYNIT